MKNLVAAACALLLTACMGPLPGDYSATTPVLDMREFFDGSLTAHGMLQNRSGLMTRRFTASIEASWSGNEGTLVEHFIFDDGEEQDRTWTLQLGEDGVITGTAGDVVGTAEGVTAGSVLNWQYQLLVPYGDSTIQVNLDDWLYLIDENTLLNRTTLTKFGFRVGELTLVISKDSIQPL